MNGGQNEGIIITTASDTICENNYRNASRHADNSKTNNLSRSDFEKTIRAGHAVPAIDSYINP